MSAGTQCDNCRVFGPQHAPGWFYLGQQPRDDDEPALCPHCSVRQAVRAAHLLHRQVPG